MNCNSNSRRVFIHLPVATVVHNFVNLRPWLEKQNSCNNGGDALNYAAITRRNTYSTKKGIHDMKRNQYYSEAKFIYPRPDED